MAQSMMVTRDKGYRRRGVWFLGVLGGWFAVVLVGVGGWLTFGVMFLHFWCWGW
jgi:hypothetical protein